MLDTDSSGIYIVRVRTLKAAAFLIPSDRLVGSLMLPCMQLCNQLSKQCWVHWG